MLALPGRGRGNAAAGWLCPASDGTAGRCFFPRGQIGSVDPQPLLIHPRHATGPRTLCLQRERCSAPPRSGFWQQLVQPASRQAHLLALPPNALQSSFRQLSAKDLGGANIGACAPALFYHLPWAAERNLSAQVYPKPHVAVMSTGDEVVEPATVVLGDGQIRDSNRAMLVSACQVCSTVLSPSLHLRSCVVSWTRYRSSHNPPTERLSQYYPCEARDCSAEVTLVPCSHCPNLEPGKRAKLLTCTGGWGNHWSRASFWQLPSSHARDPLLHAALRRQQGRV